MTIARRKLVYESEVGVYHVVVRCVRRAFLCGADAYSGVNYDHRKEWIRGRLAHLSEAFAMDVLTYSVMSNHLHVVLRTRPDVVQGWGTEEVAQRWLSVYTPKHESPEGVRYEVTEGDVERKLSNPLRLSELRSRLGSLSWFMKALNEHISRRANKEDGVKGRFWESRFKCQRLEDEGAILACMCYVDLNPVRSRLAESLEDSEFTGAYDRIMARKAAERAQALECAVAPISAQQLAGEKREIERALDREKLLCSLDEGRRPFAYYGTMDYLRLLDATGRALRLDKPGRIGDEVRPLLESLDLDADEWLETVRKYGKRFGLVAGTVEHMREAAQCLGQRWLKGCRSAAVAFRRPPTSVPA
ncbi:MAG: transposase [Candidatus Marinimicrobia bacterium]|nr:transposase [Candidatus Neomarinimicrobiota bacterium]